MEELKIFYTCEQKDSDAIELEKYENHLTDNYKPKTYTIKKQQLKKAWRNFFETEAEAIADYKKAEEIATEEAKKINNELKQLLNKFQGEPCISSICGAWDDSGLYSYATIQLTINFYKFNFNIER